MVWGKSDSYDAVVGIKYPCCGGFRTVVRRSQACAANFFLRVGAATFRTLMGGTGQGASLAREHQRWNRSTGKLSLCPWHPSKPYPNIRSKITGAEITGASYFSRGILSGFLPQLGFDAGFDPDPDPDSDLEGAMDVPKNFLVLSLI